ncbi:hypothetical protein DFO70_103480 [Cytobacillus firmus]|uniref:Uncharacterized protein n=2 Tax=Cytobacillus TaxID=2675230 RepID=A0A366K0Z3_CYTFI|nr:hypothetical protein DFO70_103480 [Cytobacillus firmus]TDX44277.1 hypothetical protein DFO72_104493 [Cytobacillus oceanisediminis]
MLYIFNGLFKSNVFELFLCILYYILDKTISIYKINAFKIRVLYKEKIYPTDLSLSFNKEIESWDRLLTTW